MASYHIYGVACGETTVESQDHEYYRRMARGRGEVSYLVYTFILRGFSADCMQDFVNSYDLGYAAWT